jgi:hypothetical protein
LSVYLAAYRPAEVHSRPPPRGGGHSCPRASGRSDSRDISARIEFVENSPPWPPEIVRHHDVKPEDSDET